MESILISIAGIVCILILVIFGLIFMEDMMFGITQRQWTPHYSPTWRRQIQHEGILTGTFDWFMYVKDREAAGKITLGKNVDMVSLDKDLLKNNIKTFIELQCGKTVDASMSHYINLLIEQTKDNIKY